MRDVESFVMKDNLLEGEDDAFRNDINDGFYILYQKTIFYNIGTVTLSQKTKMMTRNVETYISR